MSRRERAEIVSGTDRPGKGTKRRLAMATGGTSVELRPGSDVHRALADVRTGTDVVLHSGDHAVKSTITIGGGGRPGAPVVIRGAEAHTRPRIVCRDRVSTVIGVRADHVILRGLHFGPTPDDVHAVTLYGASGVTVEDCVFEDVGGLAIVESMTATSVVIRGNAILRSRATAMYFGCHSGSCSITDLLIEGNYIDGVAPAGRWVGYGVQVKLDSCAVVRDNVIVGTKGPPVMVYGTRDRTMTSRVEGNYVSGSRESSGIVIGGGPVIVRDNVSVGNAKAGIALQDYGRRHLLRGIDVSGNSLYGNRGGGVVVTRGRCVETRITGNVAYTMPGTASTPSARRGATLADNVEHRLSRLQRAFAAGRHA